MEKDIQKSLVAGEKGEDGRERADKPPTDRLISASHNCDNTNPIVH